MGPGEDKGKVKVGGQEGRLGLREARASVAQGPLLCSPVPGRAGSGQLLSGALGHLAAAGKGHLHWVWVGTQGGQEGHT